MKKIIFILLIGLSNVQAGPTKVGNGDDGSDLEGFVEIRKGKIFESRKKAVLKLKKLNIQSIEYLGSLIPEVENTKLYLTKRDISTKKLNELGAFHSGQQKFVYARTFARPYAATRFFPAATKLDDNQLIALHIHEGLHRSLPEDFKQNEEVVSLITLAIIDPMTSYDQVRDVVEDQIKSYTGIRAKFNRGYKVESIIDTFKYNYKRSNEGLAQLKEKIKITNHIFPFSSRWSLLGLGASLSYLNTTSQNYIGPLELFFTADLFTMNGFDLTLFSKYSRSTGGRESISSLIYNRDHFTLGAQFIGKSDQFFGRNIIEFITARSSSDTLNGVEYNFEFGSLTHIKAEIYWSRYDFQIGGIGEFFLIGESSLNSDVTGRSNILGLGPSVEYKYKNIKINMNYYHVISRDGDSNDKLSINDLLSNGAAQSQLQLSLKYYFK